MKKQLYRSRDNRYFTGLAGGIAEYFNIDSSLVRILFIFFEFSSAGLLIIPYFIVAFFVPYKPENSK